MKVACLGSVGVTGLWAVATSPRLVLPRFLCIMNVPKSLRLKTCFITLALLS